MAAFDVATAIAEFLADAERTNLELPHMTTGQRKNAKKLLENYPELRCESYGFGAERQLHVFKKCAAANSHEDKTHEFTPPAVSIKNTFIDDWATPTPEPVMFRSLQPRLDGQKLDFSSIVKMSAQEDLEKATPPCASENTGASTVAGTLGSLPAASERDDALPVAHEEIQVRNTFIHFEGAPVNERAVQSMPHGMFKQCILAEAPQLAFGCNTPSTTGYDTPTSASEFDAEMLACPLTEPQAGQSLSLGVGALVVVEGLTKVPAFNGRSAVVQGWDEATGRYNILLASSEGSQQAKIKEENLRVVLPCP